MENESNTRVCAKCGSHHLMPDLPLRLSVPSHGQPTARLETRPQTAWLHAQYTNSLFTATICGTCGHTELHADDFAKLWQLWQDKAR